MKLVSFKTFTGMTISSITFPHKATWESSHYRTKNQIDHVLNERRYRSGIVNVISYSGADYDTDHFLVIAQLKSSKKN